MKTCNSCHVLVQNKKDFCPLCGTPLDPAQTPAYPLPSNHYPDLSRALAKYNFVVRILLLITLLGSGVSLLVNLLVSPGFLWSLIVIAASTYCWLVVPPLLRRGVNYAAQTVLQVFGTSLLMIVLDSIIGFRGWSISYVIPGLLMAGILSIGLMAIFNRTFWSQYVLYQVLMGVFGFIPLLLYLLGLPSNLLMVIFTGALAMASLLITFIFSDRTVKNEFKRRFHL